MNTKDTKQLIKTVEQMSLQNYLERLIHAKLSKVTLYSRFPLTSSPNLSDPHSFIMIEDIAKIAGLNGGKFNN